MSDFETRAPDQLEKATTLDATDLLIKQTPGGPAQAIEAGRALAAFINADVFLADSSDLSTDADALALPVDSTAAIYADPVIGKSGLWVKVATNGDANDWAQTKLPHAAISEALQPSFDAVQQAVLSTAQDKADAAEILEAITAIFDVQPNVQPPAHMSYFGQESADLLADIPGRGISHADAQLMLPPAGENWYYISYSKTGDAVAFGTQYEVLASTGNNIISGSGTKSAIFIHEKGSADPLAWKWGMTVNYLNRDLLTGITPALTTQPKIRFGDYCHVIGVMDGIPYVAIGRIGLDKTWRYFAKCDSIEAFDSYHFPGAIVGDAIQRTAGIASVTKAGFPGSYQPGDTVLVESSDASFNGIQTIVARLAGNTGFTFASEGPDTGSIAAPLYAEQRAPIEIFKMFGRLETAINNNAYGWSGGIQRVELRYGDLPITDGQIDPAWFDRLAAQGIASGDLSGQKYFACDFDPVAGFTPDDDGTVTDAPAAIGNLIAAPPIGAAWLRLDDRKPGLPFAAVAGEDYGTVEIGFDYGGYPRAIRAEVYDAAGNLIWAEREVAGAYALTAGRGVLKLENVPAGVDHSLRVFWESNGDYSLDWGPFAVDDLWGVISQSTLRVGFDVASTGGAVVPADAASGYGIVGDVAGGITQNGTNFTDQDGDWCRLRWRRIVAAGQVGDGFGACIKKFVETKSAAKNRKVALGVLALCRSGHGAETYWSDRRRYVASIGNAAPGVQLSGTWTGARFMAPNTPKYTRTGAARLYRGGTFELIDQADPYSQYRLVGGTLVAECDAAGNWVGSVAGTFNVSTGAYTVTDPVGGNLYISTEMLYDTGVATTATRTGNQDWSTFGDDAIEDSGFISNLLRQAPRLTGIYYAWANYLLSYATGASQADVNIKVAADIAQIRARCEQYPALAGLPWIIGDDPRTTSTSSIGEHKVRIAAREYALNTPNTSHAIGAITSEMDALNSPHAGPAAGSGQLLGMTIAHGILKATGIAGAQAERVTLQTATRSADRTTMTLTFDVPAGRALANAGGEVEGVAWFTPGGLWLENVLTGAHDIQITGDDTVTIVHGSGTWPDITYWNANVGFVLQDVSLAAEKARLENCLHVDSDGYDDIRPGYPVSASSADILAVNL